MRAKSLLPTGSMRLFRFCKSLRLCSVSFSVPPLAATLAGNRRADVTALCCPHPLCRGVHTGSFEDLFYHFHDKYGIEEVDNYFDSQHSILLTTSLTETFPRSDTRADNRYELYQFKLCEYSLDEALPRHGPAMPILFEEEHPEKDYGNEVMPVDALFLRARPAVVKADKIYSNSITIPSKDRVTDDVMLFFLALAFHNRVFEDFDYPKELARWIAQTSHGAQITYKSNKTAEPVFKQAVKLSKQGEATRGTYHVFLAHIKSLSLSAGYEKHLVPGDIRVALAEISNRKNNSDAIFIRLLYSQVQRFRDRVEATPSRCKSQDPALGRKTRRVESRSISHAYSNTLQPCATQVPGILRRRAGGLNDTMLGATPNIHRTTGTGILSPRRRAYRLIACDAWMRVSMLVLQKRHL